MRIIAAIVISVLCAGASGAERPPFQTLRYNEDWSFLSHPEARTDPFDVLKYLPLDGTNAYVSFGGEARLRYEFYGEPVFNQKPADADGFLLQRYLFHTDIHATPYLRAFGQLQSSLEGDRVGGPRPTDRNALDLHQAFLDVNAPPSGEGSLTLRAGRQEMAYGSQRLISVREAPNNRLAFDALRFLSRLGGWSIDAWLAQPVDIRTRVFDDRRMQDTTLWGAYAGGPLPALPGLWTDFYYLGLRHENARFARGRADETRHSLGTRLYGRQGGLDWNFEFVGQFGSFGDRGILAWTAASDTGWTFSHAPAAPRAFLRADIVSGDHGGSTLGTFNPLFPRGSYFNEASLIGPQNLIDLQPGVEFALASSLKLTTSCDWVWRESLDDGLYGTAGNLQVAPGLSRARFVGTFPSATLAWQASRHMSLLVNYVAYVLGGFVNQSQPSQRDGSYVSATLALRF